MQAIDTAQQILHRRVVRLMGSRFEINITGDDEVWANNLIESAISEIRRIERLLTTFNDSSQTNLINANAGIKPVRVDKEVFNLIYRSIQISDLTHGAFDISYGSIDTCLWNFDKTMTPLPDAATAKKMVRLINYKNIILDKEKTTVFLKEKGMRIGFGGIGKGYAADRARLVLEQNGILSGVVNAAGDRTTWDTQPNGKPWPVGITDPDGRQHPFSFFDISGMAVATSKSNEKYVSIGGKKYSHTIDPKTGLPVHGIKSVTIICPSAELADALATAVTVMGIKAGLNLINQMKNIACIIIDDDNKLCISKKYKSDTMIKTVSQVA